MMKMGKRNFMQALLGQGESDAYRGANVLLVKTRPMTDGASTRRVAGIAEL